MEKIKQNQLWGVYSNDFQAKFLAKNITDKDIAHAYLFAGPEKIGKKKTAISFIKAILCQNSKTGEFCADCDSCKKIDSNTYPDVKIIEGNETVKISSVRDIISNLSLKPFNSSHKIVVIDNAERMNEEASNALLKTLEEPTGHAIIILITKNSKLLLSTIVSRSRIIKFFLASSDNMKLAEKDILGESSDLGYLCSGKIGKLIDIENNTEAAQFYAEASKDIHTIIKSGVYENLTFAEHLYIEYEKENQKFMERLDIWTTIVRGLILENYHTTVVLDSKDAKMSISPKSGAGIIDFLAWTKNNLINKKSGLNYKLIIDKLVLDISRINND